MKNQFEAGKTYYTNSVCDNDCTFKTYIVSRTAKTVTIKMHGYDAVKKRITVYNGSETIKPLGSYSMAPVISSEKELS